MSEEEKERGAEEVEEYGEVVHCSECRSIYLSLYGDKEYGYNLICVDCGSLEGHVSYTVLGVPVVASTEKIVRNGWSLFPDLTRDEYFRLKWKLIKVPEDVSLTITPDFYSKKAS